MPEPDLSDLDAIIAADRTRRRSQAKVCGVKVAKVDHPDKADLIDAAIAHEAGTAVVTDFLNDNGVTVTFSSIQRHRRGRCLCPKPT